jgi:hypothetical protein
MDMPSRVWGSFHAKVVGSSNRGIVNALRRFGTLVYNDNNTLNVFLEEIPPSPII